MARNSGGNAHQRDVLASAVAKKLAKELGAGGLTSIVPNNQPSLNDSNLPRGSSGKRFVKFVEHPAMQTGIGILGGVAALLWTPALAVPVFCIMWAFYRSGIVRGKGWLQQVIVYVFLLASSAALVEFIVVKIKQQVHLPTLQEIAAAVTLKDEGFIQFEDQREVNVPGMGQPITVNFHYVTEGARPVTDVHSWGAIRFLDSEIYSPEQVKKVWEEKILEAQLKFARTGTDLGPHARNWNTGVSDAPFSDQMVSGLRSGKLRVFILAAVTWRNEADVPHTVIRCEWNDWNTFPKASPNPWHTC